MSAFKDDRFKFKNVGTMSYEVFLTETGELVGSLWRNTEGWYYRPVGGKRDETYGLSRQTSAGCLYRAYRELQKTKEESAS